MTEEITQAAAWLLTACAALLQRETPFHLADLAAANGMRLIADYLPRCVALRLQTGEPVEPPGWKDIPYPVLSRTGFDPNPRPANDPLFERLAKETCGPRLLRSNPIAAPDLIEKALRPHPQEGLLVYSASAVELLTPKEYERLLDGICRLLAPWGDRGFWADFGTPRNAPRGPRQLRVHRVIDGRLQSRALAVAKEPRVLTLTGGWDFVRPLNPPQPQRITREEPGKQIEPGTYRFPH